MRSENWKSFPSIPLLLLFDPHCIVSHHWYLISQIRTWTPICVVLCSTLHLLAAVLPACLLLHLTFPYLILSFLTSSYLTSLYLILPYLILPYLTLSYLTLSYRVAFICPALSVPYHAPSICICSQYGAFKESICSALERSSRAVEDAKTSMDELADQAELIVQVAWQYAISYSPSLLYFPPPPLLPRTATAMGPIDLLNELSPPLSHLLSLLLAHPSKSLTCLSSLLCCAAPTTLFHLNLLTPLCSTFGWCY